MSSVKGHSRAPTSARSLLYVLSRILNQEFQVVPVGGVSQSSDSPGMIEFQYRGRTLGYVNSAVLAAGVLGYNFGRYDRATGAIPWPDRDSVISKFLSDHPCDLSDIEVQGPEKGTQFMVIKDRKVAVRVLLADKSAIDRLLDSGGEG